MAGRPVVGPVGGAAGGGGLQRDLGGLGWGELAPLQPGRCQHQAGGPGGGALHHPAEGRPSWVLVGL
jgi:hypothetical protein